MAYLLADNNATPEPDEAEKPAAPGQPITITGAPGASLMIPIAGGGMAVFECTADGWEDVS